MIESDIIKKVETYVKQLFEERKQYQYSYHNQNHTLSVVRQAIKIGKCCRFTPHEMFVLVISAWFHDVGYLYTTASHEEKGKLIAMEFLASFDIERETLVAISECIDATHFPQKPTSKISYALCDADLFHLSEDDFFEKSLKMKMEINELYNKDMDLLTYWEVTYELFMMHTYHSPYGKKVLARGKERNCLKLRERIDMEKAQTLANS